MAKRRPKKPMLKFPKRMQKKMIVMFTVVAALMIGLIGRLMYIEYTSGEKYEKIVLAQQGYDSQTIPYQRGDIVDAKGTVLATSIAVYNVILDCSVLNDDEKYVEPTINALVSCFPDLTSEQLYSYLKDSPDSRYIVLAKRLSYDTIQPFVNLQEERDEKGKLVNPYIKGVWFEKEYQRQYPYGKLASSVIGFTTSGNLGINGLENYYDDTLNGINGRQYGYLNSDSNFEKTIKPAVNGNTLVTTIDATIQSVVEKKIQEFNEAYTDGYREGEDYLNSDSNFEKTIKPAVNGNTLVTTIDATIQSVVEKKIQEFNEAYTDGYREGEGGATRIGVLIMKPDNGDVLAMAQYPNYDLSNPWDLSEYYTQEEIDAMDDDARLEALNQLWQNICLTYTYEPGSTAKPFTVAAGLETGTLSTNDTFFCDGAEQLSGFTVKCVAYRKGGHGMQTLEQTLMNSCNDALMQMSYRIGAENFTEYQQIFGFGQKTNIDLPGESRTDSLIYTLDTTSQLSLATNAFGQNFNTTMIQLGTAFCSLVNGGKLYQPRVVSKITDQNGNTIQDISPTLLRETVSKTTSDTLKQYMYSTVTSGTGNTAKVDGYSMGGKTGTAQKVPRDGVNYLVSFIGFAPVDDPQLMIYCFVDEPNSQDQPHSTFAQNIVREILEEVLPYMNIYPDEETTGLHSGWDITGTDTGAAAVTDRVTGNIPEEEPEGTDDVPDTMEDIPGAGENKMVFAPSSFMISISSRCISFVSALPAPARS